MSRIGNPYDPALQVETKLSEADIVWYDAAKAPFRHFGECVEGIPFRRIPPAVAETVSPGVAWHGAHGAGIRLRFATDSPYIALQVKWPYLDHMPHFAITGSCGFDLYTCRQGLQAYVGTYVPPIDAVKGFESIQRPAAGGMTEYVLNLPLYNPVDELYIGIQEDCTLIPGTETYVNDLPVVFYGSSITQGGCASRPGTCYQNVLSRRFNMDYVNLGFSGSAKGEDAICAYIAGLPMAAFVCDYDYNAPTVEHLQNTHYKLYETVRAQHPDMPYVMVSRPNPGYGSEARQRLAVITDSYRRALAAGDEKVYFVNGGGFFRGDMADSCTVDGCHPTDLGFYFMADGLSSVIKHILNAR